MDFGFNIPTRGRRRSTGFSTSARHCLAVASYVTGTTNIATIRIH